MSTLAARPRPSTVRRSAKAAILSGSAIAPGLAALAACIALLAIVAIATGDLMASALCATALGTVVVMLVTASMRKNYDLFEPFTFVILSALIGTTFKVIYIAFGTPDQVDRVLLNQHPDVLLIGSVFVLLGLTALAVGYSLNVATIRPGHWRIFRRPYWDRRVLIPVVGTTLLVSLFAFAVWFRRLGLQIDAIVDLSQKRFVRIEGADYGTGLSYISWAVSAAASAFYVLLAWRLSAKRRLPLLARMALSLSGIIAIAFPIFKSSRLGLAEVILTALILQHYLRPGIRWRTLALVLPVALSMFVLVTAVRGRGDVQTAADRISVETLLNATVGGRHFMDVGKTSHIIEAVPETVPYRNGATLLTWATAPIPRAWWPEKPTLGPGPFLGSEVFGSPGAAVPPGFVAELYMNFGALGVPLGMFMLGVLLKGLYAAFSALRKNPNAVLLYAVTVVPLSFGLLQADFSMTVVNVLTGALPLALLVRAMGRDRRGPTTT